MRALLLSLVLAFVISSAGCSGDIFEPEPERDPNCTYYKNGDVYCPIYYE